ncbi:MAG: hypothetical protein WBO95_08290 [Candidatus Dechloromonas phosphoritropha]|jgi:uncharacterized Zn finger protein (UPF0148 family)
MISCHCEKCGAAFIREDGEDWKTLCLACWKKSPKAKNVAADRLAQLTAENTALLLERDTLRRSLQAAISIPPDMLARLIRLCHPDRHGNSEASNMATAWLLVQRT